jgi:hypothetical protein
VVSRAAPRHAFDPRGGGNQALAAVADGVARLLLAVFDEVSHPGCELIVVEVVEAGWAMKLERDLFWPASTLVFAAGENSAA